MKQLNLLTLLIVISLGYYIKTAHTQQSPGVCYFFGDSHLIPFAQAPGENNAQYRCQRGDTQILISNQYVYGTVSTTTNPYWKETFQFEFYDEVGELICSVTSQSPHCDDATKRGVEVDSSSNSVNIYYQYSATEDLRIQITIYTIGGGRTVHDIQIMQNYPLIQRSFGQCVTVDRTCDLENNARGSRRRTFTATLAAQVCGIYLKKAHAKIRKLALPVSPTSVSHAKAACINDLRISNNEAFATSTIIFLLRDGLYRKTMNNIAYGKEIAQILQAIEQATTSAHREAMILLRNSPTNLA